MKIDIMLVSKDRPSEIGILLESLRHQEFKKWDLYIMDDRSGTPYTQYHFIQCLINQLKLEGHNVIMLRNDIPYGVTRLRQIVVDKIMDIGEGNCIARLDDDNVFSSDYFLRLVKCLEQGYDIASGLVPPCGQPTIKREIKYVKPFISDIKMNDKGELIQFGDDCGYQYIEKEILPSVSFRSMALMRKEVHKKVKYEDNLGFCSFREEQFFSFRALVEGFKICVDTGAIAYHLNTPSGGERTKDYYDNLNRNHEILNKISQKMHEEHGDFLSNYREKFK